ncbi:MAG: phosphate signaling complex protein PhoU [Clostridiales bacterium]|jgi:phosphate transport system protein|nr:phosphate signaling complex protein PhoU [Clostridiales bacterium]
MMRRFDKQLNDLNDKLLGMGALVEKSIKLATQALKEQDTELAKKIIGLRSDVEKKEKRIESLCLKLIMQHQPVARDLRFISAALKMITDMERIGKQAADISEITLNMNGAPYIGELEHLSKMPAATVKMVTESIDAYVKKDLELAKSVIEYDDVVDSLFNAVKFDLFQAIKNQNSEQILDLLMIAKYYERIGDHACNIAKSVVFSITGSKE